MLHFVDGESELFLDDALLPISVATWSGPPTLKLIEKFSAWCNEQAAIAKRETRPVLMVNDSSAAGRPNADVRRAFADLELDPAVVLRNYVVIVNPLVRGAMTAISWLIGDRFEAITCKTMAEAIEQAAAYARSIGLTVPPATEMARYATRSSARTA